MGWQCAYSLIIVGADKDQLASIHGDLLANEDACYALDVESEPEHDEDHYLTRYDENPKDEGLILLFKTLSRRYPGVRFELYWHEDIGPDMGVFYFWKGRMVKCPAKIVYPPFKETDFKRDHPLDRHT